MEKKDLINNFVQWVAQTSGKPFPNSVFLKATLDDQAALAANTKHQGTPIMNHYSVNEMYHYLFSAWKSNSLMLLQQGPDTTHVNLRGVSIPDNPADQQYIRSLLEALEATCGKKGK